MQALIDQWKALSQYRFKVIVTRPVQEGAYCYGIRIPCQLFFLEKFGCRRMAGGNGDQVPGFRYVDIFKSLAYALGQRGVAVHEDRYVGPQLESECAQFLPAKAGLPQVVQGYQGGGCVGRSSTKATTHGRSEERRVGDEG